MTNKQLLNRLIKARIVCHTCGLKYGYKVNVGATWHEGKCDVCKKKDSVTETRDFQYLQRGREEIQKLVNEEAKSKLKPKVRIKIKKVVQTNLKNLKKELRKVTHAIVRYGETQCYTCGKTDKLQAGHWATDGAHSATRYDLNNIRPQCDQCNRWKSGNLAEYTIRLQKELGFERVEALYKKSKETHKWTREELESLLQDRKIMLKTLKESEAGIKI